MVRLERMGGGVYRVRRNYATIGYVGIGRRRWRARPAGPAGYGDSNSRVAILTAIHDGANMRPHRTRTDAVREILTIMGHSPDDYAPASRSGGAGNRLPRRETGVGRAFGVEMEITGPEDSEIISALVAAGIAMHTTNLRTRGAFSYRASNSTTWELKTDSTVQGEGLELVSPKLRGDVGLAELETVCNALNNIGATVDASCGLHVHHDMRNLDAAQIKRQVLAFVYRQDLIAQCVAPSRRRGHQYTPRWQADHAAALENFTTRANRTLQQIAYIGPRGCINLQSYARHGSVEVRYHGGTTNFRKIKAWVLFVQGLFTAAEQGAVLSTTNIEDLLRELITLNLLTPPDAATLLRFVHFGESRVEISRVIEMATGTLDEVDA